MARAAPVRSDREKATMRLIPDGRPSARKRGYTVRWEKAARGFLLKHPVCTRFGKDKGCTAVAKHVDHIKPHGWRSQALLGPP